jgi:hypothetical protein
VAQTPAAAPKAPARPARAPKKAQCGHGNDPELCRPCADEAEEARELNRQARILEEHSELLATGKVPAKLEDAMTEAMDLFRQHGFKKSDASSVIPTFVLAAMEALPGDVSHQARVVKAIARAYVEPHKTGLPAPKGEVDGRTDVRKIRAGKARIYFVPHPDGIEVINIVLRKEVD